MVKPGETFVDALTNQSYRKVSGIAISPTLIDDDGTQTGTYEKTNPYEDFFNALTENRTSFRQLFANKSNVYEIIRQIPLMVLSKNITDFSSMFYNSDVTKIPAFDTSNGTDFSSMFSECIYLTEIPLLDTSNGTDFNGMFNCCEELTTIPLIDTSKGTSFAYMFDASGMTTIPLIDTSKGTDFRYMFAGIPASTIPLIDTSNGTNFDGMFASANMSTIPPLDTSNGTTFSGMFRYCDNLTEIPPLDTSNGTLFNTMFESSAITEIPALNTSNGTEFKGMFMYATNLTKITSLNLSKMTMGYNMFYKTTKLTDIKIEGTINYNELRLNSSSLLTHESIMSFVNALVDRTSTTAFTIYFGSTNLAKLTEEEKAIMTAKNWNYA